MGEAQATKQSAGAWLRTVLRLLGLPQTSPRHCEEQSDEAIQFCMPHARYGLACTALSTSLRANGSRECAPDDRLREAIHTGAAARLWIASSQVLLAMTGSASTRPPPPPPAGNSQNPSPARGRRRATAACRPVADWSGPAPPVPVRRCGRAASRRHRRRFVPRRADRGG